MPIQDVRVIEMPVRSDVRGDVSGDFSGAAGDQAPTASMRPAAVDAVQWGAALMMQLGLDPRSRNMPRRAA